MQNSSSRRWPPTMEDHVEKAQHYIQLHSLHQVPRQYKLLLQRTECFIGTVQKLTQISEDLDFAASALVDYIVSLFCAEKSWFQCMLNGQRCHILRLLDDALLSMCLEEWDRPPVSMELPEVPWNAISAPILWRIDQGLRWVLQWMEMILSLSSHGTALGWDWLRQWRREEPWPRLYGPVPARWMTDVWFARSRKFLCESEKVYWIRKKVHTCLQGRLPEELAGEIIDEVLLLEKLPVGRLRSEYFPKGKGKSA